MSKSRTDKKKLLMRGKKKFSDCAQRRKLPPLSFRPHLWKCWNALQKYRKYRLISKSNDQFQVFRFNWSFFYNLRFAFVCQIKLVWGGVPYKRMTSVAILAASLTGWGSCLQNSFQLCCRKQYSNKK